MFGRGQMLAFMQSGFEFILNKFCLQLVILLGCDVRKLTLSKIIFFARQPYTTFKEDRGTCKHHSCASSEQGWRAACTAEVSLRTSPASYLGQLAGPKA